MKLFGLSDQAIGLIREVFEKEPRISRVVIFGSRAMGNFHDSSDIDLALEGNIDQVLLGHVMLELDQLPMPYLFDVKDYADISYAPLKTHIDEYGKILFERKRECRNGKN